MHKKIIKSLLLLFFAGMTVCMLLYSSLSAKLALEALNLWFLKMIPALLPFMILSGFLINTGLSDRFAALSALILRPLFRLSDSCLYCILIGFLCGFPMGARVCAQSYEKKKLTRQEATLLLAFCNNIGPVYFTGYVCKLFPAEKPACVFFGMYGIPLLYGLTLRYTLFRDIRIVKTSVRPAQATAENAAFRPLSMLHTAILSSLDGITVLGGYMIFCNLLNLIPTVLLQDFPRFLAFAGPFFEITSGISRLAKADKVWCYIMLPFGGLSCIAQTYSCIQHTDLSLPEYVFHKTIQTLLTMAFYSFFPI